ncbi:MAG TPA: PKD domain-containing protein, partial [Phnomibacter sp.]|nr:PKD domain-containing protein [Phnomibacter sp.]
LIGCLYISADDISMQNPSFPGQLGAGRINAEKAMACVATSLNNPPLADLSISPATIIEGGSVTFTDKSIYNPTTWQWSFPGGTPSNFTGKTPPAIVYNAAGQYNVSLTVTNAFGNNTKTITNAVTVNAPPSCVAINFPVGAGTVLDFLAPPAGVNGFQNGTNANGDKQKAMYFDVSATNLVGLTAIHVRFNHINSINPNKVVRFRVYDGTSGTPGAQLGVVERTKGQLRQHVLANQYSQIDLPKNIDLPASKKFFVSVDISELVWTENEKDSLSIRALVGSPASSPVWYQNAQNEWIQYGSQNSTWGNAAQYLLIHPYLTSKPAKAMIAPADPAVCQGTLVEFDATGSEYTDLLKWELPGANPPNVVENQLKVIPQYAAPGTYKIYLSTRGGCSEIRMDSTVLTINAAPALNIATSKNPICVGESATLTASGATSYSWSPATGLNTTTGATVIATPVSNTTYTVTGTLGNCTADAPFELEVRPRSAGVTLTASETQIAAPTSVTFTAAGSNGGSAPVYNFLVNGQSVQTGANNTLVRTVSPGDRIVCSLTSTEPCVDEPTVTSNEIIMESVLPITLYAFSGRKVAAGHQLNWATASESNSDRFIVERSADGLQFTNIGELKAAGNSASNRAYVYIDRNPANGKNFYRLKMQDLDGSFKFSNVIVIDASARGRVVSIFPNPTAGAQQALLDLQGVPNGRIQIS